MTPHSVFLRSGCVLPGGVQPCLRTVDDGWSVVEEIPALAFDTMIRRAGWHLLWLQGACSRTGFAFSQEGAIHRALLRALKTVPKQFNSAELDAVQVTEYPGFLIANVRVQPLHIQEYAMLQSAVPRQPLLFPAR